MTSEEVLSNIFCFRVVSSEIGLLYKQYHLHKSIHIWHVIQIPQFLKNPGKEHEKDKDFHTVHIFAQGSKFDRSKFYEYFLPKLHFRLSKRHSDLDISY